MSMGTLMPTAGAIRCKAWESWTYFNKMKRPGFAGDSIVREDRVMEIIQRYLPEVKEGRSGFQTMICVSYPR